MPYNADMKEYKEPYHKEYLEGFAAAVEHPDRPCPYDPAIDEKRFEAWNKGKNDGKRRTIFPK